MLSFGVAPSPDFCKDLDVGLHPSIKSLHWVMLTGKKNLLSSVCFGASDVLAAKLKRHDGSISEMRPIPLLLGVNPNILSLN